jgi:N-acetylglucosamine kinase-like BadF-type ATPase
MILVADSGSTKCDWLLMKGQERQLTNTMGFNPFFVSAEKILTELGKNEFLSKNSEGVNSIFFYGAGCSSQDRNQVVERALSSFFPNLSELTVDHDLLGAAVATCGTKPGITCILGTGSNSCYFDGVDAHEEIPSLSYILGDEGSGAFFGKILLSEFLYGRLPKELEESFRSEYELTKESIFENIYSQGHPNTYLASFMKFVSKNIDHEFMHQMMFKGLAKFADVHIKCYKEYKSLPVHFVGSIAFHFVDILSDVAKNMGFNLGKVIKKPIDSLADFHSSSN